MQSIFLTLTLVTIFLSGCSSSNISLSPSNIQLTSDKEKLTLQNISDAKQNSAVYDALTLNQYILNAEQNSYIVLENMDLETAYEWKFTPAYTVRKIFDAPNITTVAAFDRLLFFKVQQNRSETINVIVNSTFSSSLQILYGFNDQSFSNIITNFKNKKSSTSNVVGKTKNIKSAIKSRWNAKLFIFNELYENTGDSAK
ncbi:MAG: hypothetical protein GQ570_10545 [Helicobacteraceae bacterium]|nr:hypothetical protein [Helicobacteraceae bacterium]